ncbi:hypothetical protein KDA00_00900 [Candidatus Saccharibacteria bacterium]|nr:hypothetical protein [Candidatus Saccharibacteria bacterium]
MTKLETISYVLLDEWTISQNEKTLLISGGADAQFEIVLEAADQSLFSSLGTGKTFVRDQLNNSDQRVLEELITAGIVIPKFSKVKPVTISILGDVADDAIWQFNNKILKKVEPKKKYDVALVTRTNSSYSELLGSINYQSIAVPHLFTDMAYHHTFSIGPLVFPGETACIACLQGRISTRWGDDPPPEHPRAHKKYTGLISELISTELERIANGDMSLVNKTVSWNFQDRKIKNNQLLKVPLCPICSNNKIDHTGALELPW